MRNILFCSVIIALLCMSPFTRGEEGPEDIKNVFAKFFTAKGSDAFAEFIKESQKKLKLDPFAPKDSKSSSGTEASSATDKPDEAKAKEEEIPIQGKVFAFYGKSYGCAKSKVYEEFLKQFRDGNLANPIPDEETDDKWLKKLAKKEVDVDGSANTPVQTGEEKLKKLDKDQLQVLKDGETQMPTIAQIFLHFVRGQGCSDNKLDNYKQFNELFKAEVDKMKKKEKKFPQSYYLSKADTILAESF